MRQWARAGRWRRASRGRAEYQARRSEVGENERAPRICCVDTTGCSASPNNARGGKPIRGLAVGSNHCPRRALQAHRCSPTSLARYTYSQCISTPSLFPPSHMATFCICICTLVKLLPWSGLISQNQSTLTSFIVCPSLLLCSPQGMINCIHVPLLCISIRFPVPLLPIRKKYIFCFQNGFEIKYSTQ